MLHAIDILLNNIKRVIFSDECALLKRKGLLPQDAFLREFLFVYMPDVFAVFKTVFLMHNTIV